MIRSHHTVAAPIKVILLHEELAWMKCVTFTCNTQHIHVRLGHLYNEPPFYRNGSTNPREAGSSIVSTKAWEAGAT
jgi:hypothetical protein